VGAEGGAGRGEDWGAQLVGQRELRQPVARFDQLLLGPVEKRKHAFVVVAVAVVVVPRGAATGAAAGAAAGLLCVLGVALPGVLGGFGAEVSVVGVGVQSQEVAGAGFDGRGSRVKALRASDATRRRQRQRPEKGM
jgi:hypothetical protein